MLKTPLVSSFLYYIFRRLFIEDYLLTIVSGKKHDAFSELGTLIGSGKTIVDLNKLQEMVNSGINIVSAKYINDKMIEIEFQEFRKKEIKGKER